jgi:dihydropteroate synthase
MGIVNVTPDSFSDGGDHLDPVDAIAHGRALVAAGADVLDVGGESTRPGAAPVDEGEEIRRVIPVVRALTDLEIPVSIDTSKAAVAEAAVRAGASIVNDVTAFGDPEMPSVVAETGAGVVLMHMQGEPRTMQADPVYEDVVAEVTSSLLDSAERAIAAGVDRRSICLDPGIGFGKTLGHNLDLLATGVGVLRDEGFPVLVGASRKSFISMLVGDVDPREREPGTVAAHVLAIAAGATVIRTHDVASGLQSARMADAIVRGNR